MSDHNIFNYVNVYHVDAVCETPFHVGSGEGEQGEILIHPVTGMPFVQATGIVGPFRNYSEKQWGEEICAKWFGSSAREAFPDDDDDFRSRLIFTDAVFDESELHMELRTRVSLNKETGTTDAKDVSGVKSGQVLQTEYISRGSCFSFDIYEYYKDRSEIHIIEECIAALDQGQVLIGGQLSNGCGRIRIRDVKRTSCDMSNAQGRDTYRSVDPKSGESITHQIKTTEFKQITAYDFYMDVEFDQAVLVKGDSVDEELLMKRLSHTDRQRVEKGDKERRPPDKMPLMDAHGKYVIPGSSIKGVFRNQMERIASYKGDYFENQLIPEIFEGRSKLYFYDAMLEDKTAIQTRIHIDKFTGGVIDRSLLTDAVTGGNSQIHIRLEKFPKGGSETLLQTKQTAAFLLLAMRDCALGVLNFGSGYSIGRGFAKVCNIRVLEGKKEIISIDAVHSKTPVQTDIIKDWLLSIRQEG